MYLQRRKKGRTYDLPFEDKNSSHDSQTKLPFSLQTDVISESSNLSIGRNLPMECAAR